MIKNAFIEEIVSEGRYLRGCLDRYFGGQVPGLAQIEALAKAGKIKKVVLAGMGSSYYAAHSVVGYLTQKGVPALVLNGFEAARYQSEQVDKDTLVIGISQSGKSWELAELIDKLQGRAVVAGICNKEGSRLDGLSGIKLPMFAETETFFANRSYLHSIIILNIVSHVIAGDDMGALKTELYKVVDWVDGYIAGYDAYTVPLYEMTKGADMYDFLADGPSMAAALQGGLIFREGPKAKTASIMLADYAHDWVLSVDPSYTEILFVPEFTAEVEVRMYNTIMQKGGRAIILTANDSVEANASTAVLRHPAFRESLAPVVQTVCMNFLMAYILGEGWSR